MKPVITSLLDKKLINSRMIRYRPLRGGVSSDIYLLTDGQNRYVVKQAREKLRVEDDWYADTSRNRAEQEFASYVRSFLPESVPKIFCRNLQHGFFVMEYLDSSFSNWKSQLMEGDFNPETARRAAVLLAGIHLYSSQNSDLTQTFNSTAGFHSLRTDPYLLTTGRRHPDLQKRFQNEAGRLESCREGLVHGDFSPKNMMVGRSRLVLLDHEVAWYGDPAFDVAFLLSHLYLKSLYRQIMDPPEFRGAREAGSSGEVKLSQDPGGSRKIRDLTPVVWNSYFEKLGDRRRRQMEERTGRLLLMLLLARIDGKSPVEYFDTCSKGEEAKKMIRTFVFELLTGSVFTQPEINSHWKSRIKSLTDKD